MPDKKTKFTAAQIKETIKKVAEDIEKQKKSVKKGDTFISITPEQIEEKLKRVNSPFISAASWSHPPLGGTSGINISIFNPDPVAVGDLYIHLWVGSGNVDPVTGTFLLNVDARFPRLTMPSVFSGLTTLNPGASVSHSFAMKVPATVEKTNYMATCCLMKFNYLDTGTYLDRGVFPFNVS